MSSKTNSVDKSNDKPDKELDDLLNSALDDFDINKSSKDKDSKEDSDVAKDETATGDVPEEWNEEYLKAQAKLFCDEMAEMLGAQSQETGNVPDPEFEKSITEALKEFKEGAENLQNPFSTDQMQDLFGGQDASDGSVFLSFAQGMMRSLLSADVLLPSLKDLVKKYPKYLTENVNIDSSDRERYIKQQELMERVCSELELENETDSNEVKQERFMKVLEMMQKMQEFGLPPSELVGEAGNFNFLDLTSSANNPQCSMM